MDVEGFWVLISITFYQWIKFELFCMRKGKSDESMYNKLPQFIRWFNFRYLLSRKQSASREMSPPQIAQLRIAPQENELIRCIAENKSKGTADNLIPPLDSNGNSQIFLEKLWGYLQQIGKP